MLSGTSLRHLAETMDIAKTLLGKWSRHYEQQGDAVFPVNGKPSGESAELRRLRQQLAQVIWSELFKGARHLLAAHEVYLCHCGVGRSLPRCADVSVAADNTQRFKYQATTGERDCGSVSNQ